MYKIEISERTLHFKQPAGTSRGVYTTRHSYYLTLTSDELPGVEGVGECATLPDLSCDAKPEYGDDPATGLSDGGADGTHSIRYDSCLS